MVTKTRPIVLGWKYWDRSGFLSAGPGSWGQPSGALYNRTNGVTTGANLPGWKQRIANQQSATTPLSATNYGQKGGSSDFYSARKMHRSIPSSSTYSEIKGSFAGIFDVTPPSSSFLTLTQAENAAITKWVAKAISEQRSMQGGVFIGEIREALTMIRNPFKILYRSQYEHLDRLHGRLKRRRFAGRKSVRQHNRDTLDRASEAWLESAFGWRPLFNDINDGVKALAQLSRRTPAAKRVRAMGETVTVSSPQTVNTGLGYHDFTYMKFSMRQASVKIHGAISVEAPSAPRQFGLTASDVLPTMWELIPYSFLADYFTNLGDIITGATFNSSSVKWAERGTRQRNENFLYVWPGSARDFGANYKVETDSLSCEGEYSMHYESKTRSQYLGSYTPSIRFQIPGFGLKWLNLAALAKLHTSGAQRHYRRY